MLLHWLQKEFCEQVRQLGISHKKHAAPVFVYTVLLLQVVQLLNVEQKAQFWTLHNWQIPLTNEKPVKQEVQTLMAFGHVWHAGTLHCKHWDPWTKAKPGKHAKQLVADEQLAQLEIRQLKHAKLFTKNPGLQTEHSLFPKQEAQLGTVQISQLVPTPLVFKLNPGEQTPQVFYPSQLKQFGILHPKQLWPKLEIVKLTLHWAQILLAWHMIQFDTLHDTQAPVVLGESVKGEKHVEQKLTAEQVWQFNTLQLTHWLFTCEKVGKQFEQLLFVEHNKQFDTLHGVHTLAPLDGTVNPGLHDIHVFAAWQRIQFVTLHWVHVPPNCEIVNPAIQFEQMFEVNAQFVQFPTLH